jgi:hypothetical protein
MYIHTIRYLTNTKQQIQTDLELINLCHSMQMSIKEYVQRLIEEPVILDIEDKSRLTALSQLAREPSIHLSHNIVQNVCIICIYKCICTSLVIVV